MLLIHQAAKVHSLYLLLLLPLCCKEKAGQSFSISERSVDFGPRKLNDTLNHTFTITNQSERALQIKGVETSCSCTLGNWTTRPIQPDSSGIVAIEMIVKDTGYAKRTVVIELDRDSILYPLMISVTGKN